LCSALARAGWAAGITTRLGEVWFDNVRSGQPFSVRESLNMPLKVTNTGVKPVDMKMEVWVNRQGDRDLKEGFAPLPDSAWVKLERDYFPRVEPNADAETDIVISIPGDKKYLGKKYQFYVWTKTIGGQGNVKVGVMSRFLVTVISADKLAILKGRRQPDRIRANLDFSLLPYEVFVKQVKLGKRFDLEELSGGPVKVVNPNASKLKFAVYALTTAGAKTFLKTGYEDIPDAVFFSFKEKEFTVPGESIKRVKSYLQFPDREAYRNKRYQGIIVLEAREQDVNVKVYSRVYITTEE
jgi:hypothetical protein